MNSLKDKLLDILLYPARFFERLTDNKVTLYAGIVFVGAVDLFTPNIIDIYKQLFIGRPVNDVYFNAVLAVLMVIVLGLIDVIFVAAPLFDFFKYIKKREEGGDGHIALSVSKQEDNRHIASPAKVMKVYIMSHFIVIPVSIIIYYAFVRNIGENSSAWLQNLVLVYFMLILIWSAAIITRGINTLFRFNPIFTRLTFIIVFTWNFLFGMVFDLQIMNWLLKLFR